MSSGTGSQRFCYSSHIKEKLADIITNREGGRFIAALSNKDVTKNLEKAEIWNIVTNIFNEVRPVDLF
jgi:hypothetical protein